ncbi:MAG: NEW3 domain-containing protein [Inquilinaceae bacterium]
MTPDQTRLAAQEASSAFALLWQALLPLKTVCSFMQTGAHPDDETSALLARLGRADGVRIAYANAVRGEGGQNAIGTESGIELGVLRTGEMEAASAVLDMELYWLNEDLDGAIVDFGLSKSPEETFGRWGRARTVERLVRAIRTSRPDMLCPTFLDVPGQHGHHRAITRATREAFDKAADPAAFPEHLAEGLKPWRVAKMYLPAWSGAGGSYDDTEPPPNATITVPVGDFDAVAGATHAQIAQWSRARHRTQGMGHWVDEGPRTVPLHRLECRIDTPAEEQSPLDGLPRTLADLAAGLPAGPVADGLNRAQAAIDRALAAFPAHDAVAMAVHEALDAVRACEAALPGAGLSADRADDIGHRLGVKTRQLARASQRACLLVTRLDADAWEVSPGATVEMTLSVYRGRPAAIADLRLGLAVPDGWTVARLTEDAATAPGETARVRFAVTVPAVAPLAYPYRFAFDPLGPNAPVHGVVDYAVAGTPCRIAVDPLRPLAVLPPVSVAPEPTRTIYNLERPGRLDLDVQAVSHSDDTLETGLSLTVPDGWTVAPPTAPVALPGRDASASARFAVMPPRDQAPGLVTMEARATGAAPSDRRVRRIDHPHIATRYLVTPARVEVRTLSVRLPEGLRIGYVDSGSDRVHLWLRRLGASVDLLGGSVLASGDLGQYDAIVTGIFAYGARPDLLAARERLKRYVAEGGNLVTQYHRPWDNWDPDTVPPRFLKVGQPSLRWRVTDEKAAVTMLDPDHPLLTTPNRIGPTDWDGWVKERGLYFAAEWADDYVPLLSMADPGEDPHRGALLSARIGQGRHTHTGLILHHQMDHLVPGAFRLFANLVTPPDRR